MNDYVMPICLSVATASTILQTNEVFQIVQVVLTISALAVGLAYRLWHWYKEAKKDGKITKEEIEEAVDITITGLHDIVEEVNKDDNTKQ